MELLFGDWNSQQFGITDARIQFQINQPITMLLHLGKPFESYLYKMVINEVSNTEKHIATIPLNVDPSWKAYRYRFGTGFAPGTYVIRIFDNAKLIADGRFEVTP